MGLNIETRDVADVASNKLQDIVPSRLIKVYPYEMPNASHSEEFIGNQTSSIVYITQSTLDVQDELLLDSNGDKYFNMFAAITSEAKLDLSSSSSTLGQELKEEDSFVCLSNWYYEGELNKLKLGYTRFMPTVFTIGKHFNKYDYETGAQPLYLATSMVEAKEGKAQYSLNELETEGLYEFNLVNVATLESSFTNSKLYFTTTFDTRDNNWKTFDKKNTGLTLGFENHTLINYIKAKGTVDRGLTHGPVTDDAGIEVIDIDFSTKQPLTPFKMTPINLNDKLVMYADWFDYDMVMPWVYMEKFNPSGRLEDLITNPEDLNLVKDMLLYSAGFANNWQSMPVIQSGDQIGKIDPTFRVGSKGDKISSIVDKDPITVIDSLFETHLRKYPSFIQIPTRYQPVKQALVALSRFINSTYCIGKGENSFNQIYLPWYLEPAENNQITFDTEILISNPDKPITGTEAKTYVLDNVSFVVKTNYFRSNYSSLTDLKPTTEMIIPTDVNLSNLKLVQTERKLTLPEVNYQIAPINKINNPGDIDIISSKDLSHIWYLPITSLSNVKKLFIDSLQEISTKPKGTDITVQLLGSVLGVVVPGVDGKVWTQAEADNEVQKIQSGAFKQHPTLTQVDGTIHSSSGIANNVQIWNGKKITFDVSHLKEGDTFSDSLIQTKIKNIFGYEDLDAIRIITNTLKFTYPGTNTAGYIAGTFTAVVTHTEFGPAIVTLTSSTSVKTYSLAQREILFDKRNWKAFLQDYHLLPNATVYFDLIDSTILNENISGDYDGDRNISEIIIGSCWGNYVDIRVNGLDIARIDMFNSVDESIGVQRIIFT